MELDAFLRRLTLQDLSRVSSIAELSQAFPVQAIDPGAHELWRKAGTERRRWWTGACSTWNLSCGRGQLTQDSEGDDAGTRY